MKVIIVSKNEAGQRFDKLLGKILNQAPKSFVYKMLRKKNIVLNGKKSDGTEKVVVGDEVKIFLSDETFDKFSMTYAKTKSEVLSLNTQIGKTIPIIYEDENVLLLNKPAGILSQKAKEEGVSMVEHVVSYLLETKQITCEELDTFRPGVCNRLDRNTSGLIVAGKTMVGLQVMSNAFKERTLDKYYLCIVKGIVTSKQTIKGYLQKDEATNKVTIFDHEVSDSEYIETEYEPIKQSDRYTLLSVKLITGKTHQIRAHLKSIGCPIIGDGKYGSKTVNDYFRKEYDLRYQLLHSYRMHFPKITGELRNLSEKEFVAQLPQQFQKIQKDLFLN